MSRTSWCPLARAAEVIGDRWSVLILRELAAGPRRFKTLKENIDGISMDQLSRKLDHLCSHFLVVRQEFSECPPRVEYELTDKGRALLPVLKRLLLWSSAENWGPPVADEKIDVTLNLRTMATFFGQGAGTVEIRIRRQDGTRSYLVWRDENGRVDALGAPDDKPLPRRPDVILDISEREWVRALIVSVENSKNIFMNGKFTGQRQIFNAVLPPLGALNWKTSASAVENRDYIERSLSV